MGGGVMLDTPSQKKKSPLRITKYAKANFENVSMFSPTFLQLFFFLLQEFKIVEEALADFSISIKSD